MKAQLKKIIIAFASVAMLGPMAAVTSAAVSEEEAARLGKELTPLGATRAGSESGQIPAWDGGYTEVPSGYESGDPRPNPFSDEKPLYSVTAENMDEHADRLSEGQKQLLQKYPDTYRLDIYPTHRTAAAPDWVYENTRKNATRAESLNNGYSIDRAYGGIPFPIPKTGAEVMWNHQLRWLGQSVLYEARSNVISDGDVVLGSATYNEMNFPYYFKEDSLETFDGDFWHLYQRTTEPSFKAGETILIRDPVDQVSEGRKAWQYLLGQRRVRRAPNIAYDTPNSVTSGVDFFDEVSLFIGALDKFDWKLVGKKEMYIPYNNNEFFLHSEDEVLGDNHLNPEYVRWELHRVWVVEATLADGQRHSIPRKMFYLDEDSWAAMLYDGWDSQGKLWHSGQAIPLLAYEFPAQIMFPFAMYDMVKGSYQATIFNDSDVQFGKVERWPESNFTPESLATRGIR